MSFGRMGARGRVNREITPEFVLRMAETAGTYWDTDHVAVGRDTRTTGELFANAAVTGLQHVGVDVDRLGVVPTPAAQQYAKGESMPALQITASHNPADYNGVKLLGPDGSVLDPDAVETVRAAMADDPDPAAWDRAGESRAVESANRRYVDGVLAAVDRERVAASEPTVVLDPGNGAGALTSPTLLRELGCRVRTVNAQPDGHFPGRASEPVADELDDLSSLVAGTDADLGVAHDGDADRVVFVDERGEFIEGSTALAALAAEVLGAGDTVVTTANASRRIVDVAEGADATVDYTRIGNSYVLRRVRALREAGDRVPIAGEGNGGIVYPDYHLGRDGGYVAARFVALVAERTASDVVAPYRGYYLERENVPYDDDAERERILDRAATWAEETDGEATTIDGYRVDFGDEWAMVRPSGTEPYVRVYAEARTAGRAAELAGEVRRAVE